MLRFITDEIVKRWFCSTRTDERILYLKYRQGIRADSATGNSLLT